MMIAALLTLASANSAGNPFVGVPYFVNPAFKAELDTSIATATGTVKTTLQSMRNVPSAYWLDVKSKLTGNGTDTLEGILANSASKSTPELCVFIVYDLPNRDCHAKASNGEICCTKNTDGTCNYDAAGTCADGLTEYKNEYIGLLVKVLKEYEGKVPIALVIEPDSLPNLATNQADPHCGNSATTASYKVGIPYAINTIYAAVPSIPMYLDAAHGGWVGWSDNMGKFAADVKALGILDKIRGFSTNVANYQPLGLECPYVAGDGGRNEYCLSGHNQGAACCADPCKLESQYNPANNEANYAAELARHFPGKHMIIDTGRNGVGGMRNDCANWCNARGAGVGLYPTTSTANTATIDAYFWLKTPGESDGCTNTLPDGSACKRYDSFCGSTDSIGSRSGEPKAPEAGKWFDFEVKMLAANAAMGPVPGPGPGPGPAPVTPTPAPATPTPGPPGPAPSGCPGGSLSACIGLCPSDPPAAYKACVNSCVTRCS
jgi:cellulose 1,4-beta-cellobiosidase